VGPPNDLEYAPLVEESQGHVQPEPPRRLTVMPGWLVNQVARHGQRLVAEALAVEGLRRPHFAVLLSLDEGGASSQAELGRRLGIDRSDLHAVLNDLESDGYVERLRDEDDRRRNLVELTTAGARALKRLDTLVEGAQDALLEPLTAAQRRELTRLLARLVEHHVDG
jgi:DNA-binding MarR family transcriptional regulator